MYNDFVTQLKTLVKEQINNIHTALPGEILSVDTERGLAQIKPKAKMRFTGGKTLDYPIISDVPLVFPFSASSDAAIAFPVKAGDQCLIIFSEQSIEYWLGTGDINSELKHGLSGAIAIPGLMRTVSDDFAEAVNNDCIIIRHKQSSITLSNATITIRGDVTVEGNIFINGEMKTLSGGN